MSLLRPTPGQIADRYAALLVKRDKFADARKDTSHLSREIGELTDHLPGIAFLDAKANLYSIHLAMWLLVDEVGSEPDDARVAHAARKLYGMNLDRYALIAKIDTDLGQHAGDEKL